MLHVQIVSKIFHHTQSQSLDLGDTEKIGLFPPQLIPRSNKHIKPIAGLRLKGRTIGVDHFDIISSKATDV